MHELFTVVQSSLRSGGNSQLPGYRVGCHCQWESPVRNPLSGGTPQSPRISSSKLLQWFPIQPQVSLNGSTSADPLYTRGREGRNGSLLHWIVIANGEYLQGLGHKHFVMIAFTMHSNPMKQALLSSPSYRNGNWGVENQVTFSTSHKEWKLGFEPGKFHFRVHVLCHHYYHFC